MNEVTNEALHNTTLVSEEALEKVRKARRTREQIEQEKIEKAQARIEAIKLEQTKRRIKKALELMTEAFRALQQGDVDTFTIDVFNETKRCLEVELAK